MSQRFDLSCMGFYTFDALCCPVTQIPPGGGTYFVEDFTLAVSGAAGSASIVAAKHGLNVQAIGGVGHDDMGDWVLMKLTKFGIDIDMMQRCEGFSTSSSIVTTRPDGARPAFNQIRPFDASDAEIAATLTTALFNSKVLKGTPAKTARVAATAVAPVALFAVMLWLLSQRPEAEDEAALNAAIELSVALASDVSKACIDGNHSNLAALYTEFAIHV